MATPIGGFGPGSHMAVDLLPFTYFGDERSLEVCSRGNLLCIIIISSTCLLLVDRMMSMSTRASVLATGDEVGS